MSFFEFKTGRKVWLRFATLVCLPVLATCTSSNNESPITSTIRPSNFVDLLRHVFDIYSGNAYYSTLATLPDWSDPAYSGLPSGDPGQRMETNVACLNGGTARIVPSYSVMPPLSWTFELNECQDGAAVLDGQLLREYRSSNAGQGAYVVSTGLTIVSQERTLDYSGSANEGTGGYIRRRKASGVELSLSDVGTSLELFGVNTSISISESTGMVLSGVFSVRSDLTDHALIHAQVLDEMHFTRAISDNASLWSLDAGKLELSASDGSGLVMSADNDDPASVTIQILSSDGTSVNRVEAGSIGSANLEFEFVFKSVWLAD